MRPTAAAGAPAAASALAVYEPFQHFAKGLLILFWNEIDEVFPDGGGDDRAGCLHCIDSRIGDRYDDALRPCAPEQAAPFHSGELVGKTAPVPAQGCRKLILTYPVILSVGNTKENGDVGFGQSAR